MARKFYNHKHFDINSEYHIECETQDTNYGFRHLAKLYKNYQEVASAKACYYNRTWERYTYQSVIHSLIDKSNLENKKEVKTYLDEIANGELKKEFNFIAVVAKMGEVFASTKKEANDWKLRMIKAGLGDAIQEPDDWNMLDESEKEARLNKITAELSS